MTYEKQTWSNGESGNTPITAARLNYMEEGIEEASLAANKVIPGSGTLDSRPVASADSAGQLYFATDVDGGTLYRSNGASWVQVAASVSSTVELVAVKTGSTARQSVSSITYDPDLLLGVEAATTYLFDGVLLYESSTTADIKFGFVRYDLGGSDDLNWAASGALLGATGFSGSGSWRALIGSAPAQFGGAGVGTVLASQFSGVMTTGATAIQCALAWSQNTSEAANTTVRSGSWLRLRKVV